MQKKDTNFLKTVFETEISKELESYSKELRKHLDTFKSKGATLLDFEEEFHILEEIEHLSKQFETAVETRKTQGTLLEADSLDSPGVMTPSDTQGEIQELLEADSLDSPGVMTPSDTQGEIQESVLETTSENPPILTPPDSQERYEVQKILGAGGMGIVQLVYDHLLHREVAQKQIKVQSLDSKPHSKKQQNLLWRLTREAEIMAMLEHPNIVPLYEMQNKSSGEIQFTMRKIEGNSLRTLLNQIRTGKEKSDLNRLLRIFLKACEAICYAHSRGIVHRDLKPDNIMIGDFGEVYILDWGIAKSLQNQEPSVTEATEKRRGYETIGGIGTPGYMAPEQAEHAGEVTVQADIYSLGQMLREFFTGLSPVEEINQKLKEATKKYLKSEIALPKKENKLPKEIQAMTQKATAISLKERYSQLHHFSHDVENYLKNIPVSVLEYRFDELLRKWAKRHSKRLSLLGLLMLAILTLWGMKQWEAEKEYQKAFHETLKTLKEAKKTSIQGREEREKKIKILLKSLNSINHALSYKPRTYASEQVKLDVIETLLPLCYAEEDYQLALFVVDDLQKIGSFPKKKQELFATVEQEKRKLLNQHLKQLNEWEEKYKTSEIKNQLKEGEREDFVFEISQMKEEEVFAKLLFWLNESKSFFIENKPASVLQKAFYYDIVKAIGRSRNPKAREPLRVFLQEFFNALRVQYIPKSSEYFNYLEEGKLPEIIQKQLEAILKKQNYSLEKKYYLKKITKFHYEYYIEPEEILFTIKLHQTDQFLSVYDTKKKKNNEYLQLLQEFMIALCYLQDEFSWELLLKIRYEPVCLDSFSSSSRLSIALKKFFQTFPMKTPQSINDFIHQALIYTYLENLEATIASYTEVIRLDPECTIAYYNRGSMKLRKQEWDGAILDFNEAIRLNPLSPMIYTIRGVAKAEKQEWDEAILDYNKAIQLDPQYADAYNNRGNSKLNKQDWDGALEDYNEAIRLNPFSSKNYTLRGNIKANKQDWNGAILDYNKAIEINPQNANIYHKRGTIKKEKQDWDGAMADYNESIRLDPQKIDAYYHRGLLKDFREDWEGALADYSEAIRLSPRSFHFYTNRGNTKAKRKEWNGAIADYTEAIQLNPKDPTAYNNRGMAQREKQEWNLALSDFTEAILLNPQFFEAYKNRGVIKEVKQDLEGAILDYTEAIRLNPQFFDAYNYRATAKQKKQDWESSIADYNEVIRLNPHYFHAYQNRGTAKQNRQDWEGAILDHTEAIRLNPQFFQAYCSRGFAKGKKQDWKGALADYTEAIKLNPRFIEAYVQRGLTKEKEEDFEGAIDDWEKALSLKENPWIQKKTLALLTQQSRKYFTEKDWKKTKMTLLKLKKYLPPNDLQQKQLDQKLQQVQQFLILEEKK